MPELLILDEPTNGLDPAGMKQLRDLFRMLCQEYGITIFISSHILSEVESIADTIGIIHKGQMMKEISMEKISEMNTAYVEAAVENAKRAAYVLSDKLELTNFKILDEHHIRIYDKNVNPNDISKAFTLHEINIQSIGKKQESLEDYFLKLTQEGESC